MFIKKKPVPGQPSKLKIQVCENQREGRKVKQKVIRHVGTAKDEAEVIILYKVAQLFIEEELRKRNGGSLLFDASDEILSREPEEIKYPKPGKSSPKISLDSVEEEGRILDGAREIFGPIFQELGMNKLGTEKQSELTKELIIERIIEPESKRKTHKNLLENAGFQCSLDQIYRLMTHLGKQEEFINKLAWNNAQNLFQNGVDVLFFDVTTLYFESWNQDELRDFGFSKDCKFGQVQVTLALASDNNGFPIGYKLFPGNKAEITTLTECIEEWRKSIPIQNVVFVADRGMFSGKNLSHLQKLNCKFIVACPLKKLNRETQDNILNQDDYDQKYIRFSNTPEHVALRELSYTSSFRVKNRDTQKFKQVDIPGRLIISYSKKRAEKDKKDRLKMVEKTRNRFEKKAKGAQTSLKEAISNRGYSKYLRLTGSDRVSIEIDENKILELIA